MPAVLTYSNSVTLRRIAQDLIIAPIENSWIIREVFPIETIDDIVMRWVIEENYGGLMAMRGVGGEPTRITMVGENGFEATPGYFGEFGTLDEQEMLRRTMILAGIEAEVPISVNDLIKRIFDYLKTRYYNRLKQMAGDLLNYGVLSIPLPDGALVKIANYAQVVDSPAIPYTNTTTSTPLKEAMVLQSRHGRGTSSQFNQTATRWMNSRTFTLYQLNRNPDDLGGKKNLGGDALVSLDQFNMAFVGANGPRIGLVDEFYLNEAKDTVMDIPDGVEYIIGARPGGEKPGCLMLTANANNPGNAPGPYAFVDDRSKGPTKTVPPRMDAHMGVNAGALIRRPRQIIKRVIATAAAMDALLGPVQ